MEKLEKKIGYHFKNRAILENALTHCSYIGQRENNERLEFLGDAVLELIISEFLYTTQKLAEGKMTKIRSNIVCSESLAIAADELELGKYLHMGKGERTTGGMDRKSNKADAFEALLGAVFIDSDYYEARKLVLKLLEKNIDMALKGQLFQDNKTRLQEVIQKDSDASIKYRLNHSTGPEHNKIFFCDLLINDEFKTSGSGKSKKEAEQDAAKKYLLKDVVKK